MRWFLVRQWADLGGWGVLGVTLAYAAILVVAARQLTRLGFARSGSIALMLTVSLTPVVTWAVLDLTGEWPRLPPYDAFWRYGPYAASRYLILDLATVLVVLVVWRRRRLPALMFPLSVALWWTWFHLSRLIWSEARSWKHLMPFVAGGLLALALATGRRPIAFVGVAGVFGYLAYLASEVFKSGAAFPIILAALGVLAIVATVWLQRRLPALTSRMAGTDRVPPWPIALSWIPMALALVMAVVSLQDAGERRAVRERLDREALLDRHRQVQKDAREGRRSESVPRPVPPRQGEGSAGKPRLSG